MKTVKLSMDDMMEVLCEKYNLTIKEAAFQACSDLDVFSGIGYHSSITTKEEYSDYLDWLENGVE